jgi:hypothetical protein
MKKNKTSVNLFAHFAQTFACFAVYSFSTHLKKPAFLLTVLILTRTVYCQDSKISEVIISIAEELADEESDQEAVTLFIEQLHEIAENPVNINSGDEAEISRIFFLSDFQIKAIMDHTKESGNIISAYEIASLPGFDRHTTEMMVPFISLNYKENNIPGKLKLRNNIITNLNIKPGESDSLAPGSPWKILSKYRFTSGPFSGGVTVEKDAGEKFLSPFPDFFSSHLAYIGKGIIRKIIIGDYSARFGQSTNINTMMRTGLSLTASGYMTGRDEIRPYTASDENIFLRGAAAEFSIKKLGFSLLYSCNKIDATIGSSSDSTKLFVESFYKTGLHNSTSLILKKDAVIETFYGININYDISSVRVGVTWSESRFSLPVKLRSNNPEDLYGFDGMTNGVWSVYYNSLIKRMLLYGEVSGDHILNLAMVQGITFRPSDRLSINFLYRNYSPEFTGFHGRGPGSGSSTGNEYGILGNFTFEAARHLFISAGCDIACFPWLKYRCSYPSMRKKQEVRVRYIPVENFSLEASYNYRYSMSDMENEQGIAGISELKTRTFKGIIKYSPVENITLATRIDYKLADESGSEGMLMLQDIKYRFRQVPVTIWFRHCIFNTDNWNSRLYTYENDLLYSFSIPALSGKGTRIYLMAEWEIGDIAEFRIKYGLTSLIEDDYITEEKDELRMQFRLWF